MYLLAVVIGLVLINVCDCQTVNIGNCPNVTVKTDFDLTKYTGIWYENTKNRRYWTIMDSGLKCTSETYLLNGPDTIDVENKGQRILNNRIETSKGTGRVVAPGKLAFTFENRAISAQDVPYWVLDTDYTNYSVVWSCSERAGMNAQITWILTRKSKPDPSIVRTAMEVINRNGLGRTSMIRTIHENCKVGLVDS